VDSEDREEVVEGQLDSIVLRPSYQDRSDESERYTYEEPARAVAENERESALDG